jgi:hydroxyacylglutathione hydrolase
MEEIRDALHIPVYAHRLEFPSFGDPARSGAAYFMSDEEFSRPDREVDVDAVMDLGDGVLLRFLHTPGHTMGSICILVTENGQQRAVFTGDTLFHGSAGRTDLGGNPSQLHQSLQALSRLDDAVVVYSGHGEDSTIGEEKRSNPFMRRFGYPPHDETVM